MWCSKQQGLGNTDINGWSGFWHHPLTGFRLNVISNFHCALDTDSLNWFGHKSRLLLKARMFIDSWFYSLKDSFLEWSLGLWLTQRGSGIFLLVLLMRSHFLPKLPFEVLSEKSKLKIPSPVWELGKFRGQLTSFTERSQRAQFLEEPILFKYFSWWKMPINPRKPLLV